MPGVLSEKGFQHDNYVSFMQVNEHASLNEDEVNALNILLREQHYVY